MKLQTRIPIIKQSDNTICYHSNLLLMGSCFVENIGEKLSYFKFKNLQNPFGVLFNPNAIETLVDKAINKIGYTENDVFFYNEQWHCFDAHSKLSNTSKEALLKTLNKSVAATRIQIETATHVVITLGTAWVYRHKATENSVANCHKIPQKEFNKELLSVNEIAKSLIHITSKIRHVNPNVQLIFTVSPVRHLKDGSIENTRSKAHLITAIHQIVNQTSLVKNSQLHYFPSYEIMMDELRDYRFYTEDMLHPNKTAINYIWEVFNTVWINDKSLPIMALVDTVQKGLLHKPFNPESRAHLKFLQNLEEKKQQLQKQFAHITF
ncbi:MAG: GSCFA domain-containing protein [Aestuariibaculum sp.]